MNLVYTPSMAEVGVHEAKTHLSRLLRRAAAGEEIVIARSGKPVARLVPIRSAHRRKLGRDRGLFEVPDDFNAPLPDEILKHFER
jgi:prevent-host-death family protein